MEICFRSWATQTMLQISRIPTLSACAILGIPAMSTRFCTLLLVSLPCNFGLRSTSPCALQLTAILAFAFSVTWRATCRVSQTVSALRFLHHESLVYELSGVGIASTTLNNKTPARPSLLCFVHAMTLTSMPRATSALLTFGWKMTFEAFATARRIIELSADSQSPPYPAAPVLTSPASLKSSTA